MQKKKTAICIFFITLLLATFVLVQPAFARPHNTEPGAISVHQAYAMIKHQSKRNPVLILDVRNQSEYSLGHLYDAISLPVYVLDLFFTSPTQTLNGSTTASLPPDRRVLELQKHTNDIIIVYCQGGSRSVQASQILSENGFAKVYNIIGGITAWMEANYPIYTSYHHVTVGVTENGKTSSIDIEPLLLYQANCTSCQSQSQTCSSSNDVGSVSKTILEESENRTVTVLTGSINGTTYEYTIDETILWSCIKVTDDFNKTIKFASIIRINQGESSHAFSLYEVINHRDYKLTIGTTLTPLDSVTYNSSLTIIQYKPADKTETMSMEQITFNGPVTLSQLYASLSKVAKDLAREYQKAESESLRVFAERYSTISKEIKSLSKVVATEVPEYNKMILYNDAIILDDALGCALCEATFYILVYLGCMWLMSCTYGLAYTICEWLLQITDVIWLGAYIACHEILDCESWGQPTYRYLTSTSKYEYYSTITNHEYIRGSSIDNNYAQIYCPNPPGMGQIIGTFNEEYVHGMIEIYGKTTPGGYLSDLYVYVSNDNQNWDYIGFHRVTSTSPYWINFGYSESCFKYIAIVGYDSGYSVNLYLDCVRVTE